MRKQLFVLWLCAAAACAQQLDSNSITTTASSSPPTTPSTGFDFQVTVQAPATDSLDAVLAAIDGSGIVASQLSGAGGHTNDPNIAWTFNFTVPNAGVNGTMAALLAVQRALKSPYVLDFSASPHYSVSTVDWHQCSYSDLLADAQGQALSLAALAGLRLGPVLAIATGDPSGGSGLGVPVLALAPAYVSLQRFSTDIYILNPFYGVSSASGCSLVVKFGLSQQ